MDFLQPSAWDEALAVRAERPDALPIARGTDVTVELNFDRRRPGALLDLTRIGELREWSRDDGVVRLGVGVPYGPTDSSTPTSRCWPASSSGSRASRWPWSPPTTRRPRAGRRRGSGSTTRCCRR